MAPFPNAQRFAIALLAAIVTTAAAFAIMPTPRPNLMTAMSDWRVAAKVAFLATVSLSATIAAQSHGAPLARLPAAARAAAPASLMPHGAWRGLLAGPIGAIGLCRLLHRRLPVVRRRLVRRRTHDRDDRGRASRAHDPTVVSQFAPSAI
jgi:hypothetical protein